MNLDRLIVIVGILISLIGLIAVFKGATVISWGLLALGIFLILLAGWKIWVQRTLNTKHVGYCYNFLDEKGNVVGIKRTAILRANVRGITTVWARSLTSTGEYRNFRSNEGRVSLEESTGGGINLRVDFDRPLPMGKDFTWILSYEAHGAFTMTVESVSYTARQGSPSAELVVEFLPTRVPIRIWKTRFMNDSEANLGDLAIENTNVPIVSWVFKPLAGGEYSLHWRMPE